MIKSAVLGELGAQMPAVLKEVDLVRVQGVTLRVLDASIVDAVLGPGGVDDSIVRLCTHIHTEM